MRVPILFSSKRAHTTKMGGYHLHLNQLSLLDGVLDGDRATRGLGDSNLPGFGEG